jgi:hypothetical protein
MRARGLISHPMQVTRTTTNRESNAPTIERRRTKLTMKTAGLLLDSMTALLDLLRNRYRTGEGADWIADTIEVFEDARNPAELRDSLVECMLDYSPGKMKPPRIDELVAGAIGTLIEMTEPGAADLAGKALRIRNACMHMLDPYDAGAKLLSRAPSGVYVLAPAGYTIAHQAIVESSAASPETSIKVRRSSSGRVRKRQLPTGQTCAPLFS